MKTKITISIFFIAAFFVVSALPANAQENQPFTIEALVLNRRLILAIRAEEIILGRHPF